MSSVEKTNLSLTQLPHHVRQIKKRNLKKEKTKKDVWESNDAVVAFPPQLSFEILDKTGLCTITNATLAVFQDACVTTLTCCKTWSKL